MNTPLLISPPIEKTRWEKYSGHKNHVVNMALVQFMTSSRTSYYPDNEGIPVIRFHFGNKDNSHEWYFDKQDEALRDETYKKLLERFKV